MNGLCIHGQIDMPLFYTEYFFDDIAITVIDLHIYTCVELDVQW